MLILSEMYQLWELFFLIFLYDLLRFTPENDIMEKDDIFVLAILPHFSETFHNLCTN